MKPVYSNIQYKRSLQIAGICNVMITPREWLQGDPVIDFDSGRVLTTVALQPNRFWIQLELTARSYYYAEPQKTNKSGDYYEINAGGLLNDYNYLLQQVLQTLKFNEFVVVLTDRNKRRRLIGDSNNGMKLTTNYNQKNSPAGEESLAIDLALQSEDPALFYNPDNTIEVLGNFLIDANGNYLLVQ